MTPDQASDAFLARCSGLKLNEGDEEVIREIAQNIRHGFWHYDMDRQILMTKNSRVKICSGFDPQTC
jgi:hypothetical protein